MKAVRLSRYGITLSMALVFSLSSCSCGPSGPMPGVNPESTPTTNVESGEASTNGPAPATTNVESGEASTNGSEPSTEAPDAGPLTATEDFLLAEMISLELGGGGASGNCTEFPDAPTPDVFVSQFTGLELRFISYSAVCLIGFTTDRPIDVAVSVGNSVYHSTIRPQPESVEAPSTTDASTPMESPTPMESSTPMESLTPMESSTPMESPTPMESSTPMESPTPMESSTPMESPTPMEAHGLAAVGGLASPESLFDGRELVATAGDGYLVSDEWQFVPPLPVRDDLAATGQLTVTATQGELQATTTQSLVPLDSGPGQWTVYSGEDGAAPRALAIWGFDAGSRIPIGLYRAAGDEGDYQLVEQIGEVAIPSSGVAVFDIPPSIVANASSGNGEYCVAGPFLIVHDCSL
jgi:hypothetical protein